MANKKVELCPCGSATPYQTCCEPYHLETAYPDTAEALMRSRYSAFVLMQSDYLINSWHLSTRSPSLTLDSQRKWIGLKILDTLGGSASDFSGEVEFVARFKIAGKAYRLHERSRFLKQDGLWFYKDGDFIE